MTTARVLTAPAPAAQTRAVQGPVPLGRADASQEHDAALSARPEVPWSYGNVPLSSGAEPSSLDVRMDGEGMPAAGALGRPELRALGGAEDARIHTGPAAADTARRAGADALTVGRHIAFAAGAFAPTTSSGRDLIAHELAHVAQGKGAAPVIRRQQKPAATPSPATTLGGLPEADRKRLQVVSTTPFAVTGIDVKFATTGGTVTLALPASTSVDVDPSASAVQARGLRNIVSVLTTEIELTPAPLPIDSTVTLKLDLAKYGGIDGLYRFTHVKGAAKAPNRVIVEQLGAATAPPGQKEPAAPAAGSPAPADPVADKMTQAGIVHSLAGDRLEALRAAISQTPASHLAIVKGLRVIVSSATPADAKEAGHYDPEKHAITMFANAFKATDVRFTNNGVATSYATRALLHEIGHAIDLAPLRAATLRQKSAQTARADLSTKYPDGKGGYRFKKGSDEEKDVQAVEKEDKAAEKALVDSKSRSGTGVKKQGNDFVDVIGTAAKGAAYREAAKKDGVAVSKYAATDWQESYAEAYSLFLSSPDTLKALRPATFAYLESTLPK